MKESVCYNELDHDNNEIEKFAEYESTKINIVSEKRKFSNSCQLKIRNLLVMNVAAEELN